MKTPRCDRTGAWAALAGHFEGHGRGFDLREAFARDAGRFDALSFQAPEVFADLSKNLIDTATMRFLLDLARECGVEARRDAMLRGDPINTTEGRAVLHTSLRAPRAGAAQRPAPFADDVHRVLDAMFAYVESVRDTAASGIRHVVNIGIGGSDLGPQMVVPALDAFAHPGLDLHFVSNVDGHDITPVLRKLDPAHTLFIIASKTFTTQETMANAHAAKAWFQAHGGTDIAGHFVATTTNVQAAAEFGITTTFGFWDWVGGRYSLWSSIGLPIALAIGAENFRALLAGAHAMDRHFAETPAPKNLPLVLGLIDVWYRNFHRCTSRSVAPYHQGLKRLPAYLQQLEMESNGKRVDLDGEAVPFGTSPVVWGEPGTNGQHAYFQMLHQGTDVIPVEFILVKHPNHSLSGLHGPLLAQLERQHAMLLANGLAQSQALMLGKTTEQAQAEKAPTASKSLDPLTLARHRTFPGNRPSTTLILDQLTPRALGALIALYEHRVFTSGALWGINSFDQWGVELGKALCNDLLPRLATGDAAGLDASTAGLMKRLRGVNVVFDFGGVLFRWQPHEFMARLLPERAVDADAAHALVAEFFEGFGGDWGEFDRGIVGADALAGRIAARTGLTPAEVRKVIEAVPHELQPIEGTVALLRRLHGRGHALFFLSNMPAPYADHLEAAHDFMGLFRAGVFSSRVQMLKPEPAIYAHALQAFGVEALDTLFIDDVLHNAHAARRAGWQALHFRDPAQCESELTHRGLL